MAVFIILFVLSFVVAGVHILRDEQPRTGGRVVELLLLWLLVINTGFAGLYAFSGHVFAANEVAESIGWPAGNPFQTEVGVANLTIAALGILSYWIRGNFWTAAVVATSIWLLGAALAGLVGGFISTLASNGSAVTLPALEFLCPPEHVANGTNRLSVVALGFGGTIGFYRRISSTGGGEAW